MADFADDQEKEGLAVRSCTARAMRPRLAVRRAKKTQTVCGSDRTDKLSMATFVNSGADASDTCRDASDGLLLASNNITRRIGLRSSGSKSIVSEKTLLANTVKTAYADPRIGRFR